MEPLCWDNIPSKLKETINIIFKGVDLVNLSDYEKRKSIYLI